MKKISPFRAWYYFRTGWGTYFAFIFAAINTMVVTYYLAIEKAPFLKAIFPTFVDYLIIMVIIGVPVLVGVGYVHLKRSSAFRSEADISVESNPYYFKLPPGFWREALVPAYIETIKMLVKVLNQEKISDDELTKIKTLQTKLELLVSGGLIGHPKRMSNDKDVDIVSD